jgi:hypothetical protein
MQLRKNQDHLHELSGAVQAGNSGARHRGRILVFLAVAASLTCAAQSGPQPLASHDSNSTTTPPSANSVPNANIQVNAQKDLRDQQAGKQNVDAVNVEPKKQIVDDSARLLKLATDLKAEVDKTTEDTLSLAVIRKADALEKLAHNVKVNKTSSVGAK